MKDQYFKPTLKFVGLKKIFKESLIIGSQRIVLAGMLLALSICFELLNKVIAFPLFLPFLKIEILDFWFLVALHLIGIFYTNVILIISIWLRFIITGSNPIGLLALTIADLVMLWSYFISYSLLAKHFYKSQLKAEQPKKWMNLYTAAFIGVVISIITTSVVLTLANYGFIYRMYIAYMSYPSSVLSWKKYLLPIVVPFNIIKFSINGAIFLLLFPIVMILENKLK